MTSGSLAGAEMITLRAPASRCLAAPARSRKRPVDSMTTSAPTSPQGRLAGSVSAVTGISTPSTTIAAPAHLDGARERAVDGVVAEQVRQHLDVHDVVDADPLEVGALLMGRAEHRPAGAAEAVDTDSCRHACTLREPPPRGIPAEYEWASVVHLVSANASRRSRRGGARLVQLAGEHARPVAAPVDGEAHAEAVVAPGREHVRRADVPRRGDDGHLADAAEREHDRQRAARRCRRCCARRPRAAAARPARRHAARICSASDSPPVEV